MPRKRELLEPHKGDKRYVRRDKLGRFKEVDDVSRSLSQDVRKKAKTSTTSGQGDRGSEEAVSGQVGRVETPSGG